MCLESNLLTALTITFTTTATDRNYPIIQRETEIFIILNLWEQSGCSARVHSRYRNISAPSASLMSCQDLVLSFSIL